MHLEALISKIFKLLTNFGESQQALIKRKQIQMKKELSKYLKTLSEKELIREVKKLYDKFDFVRKYYEIELGSNTEKILSEYKKKIKQEYFPSRGFGKARSSVSRKVISDFKKISIYKKDEAELLLFRVEMMLDFTLAYGDMTESYYLTLENSFVDACAIIENENLKNYYKEYCLELISKADGFGWGVYDSMSSIYEEYNIGR